MKRLLKISAKVLAWLLIIITALFILIVVLIQVPFFKNKLAQRVLVTVNQSLTGNVELGRIEGNLFTHIRLFDVVVKNDRGDLIARVPKVDATYGLLGIIRNQLTVKSLEVDNLLAVVHVYEDGSFNFATIAKPSETSGGPGNFEVFLDKIQLNDGLIIYVDESQNTAEQPLTPERAESLAKLLAVIQDKSATHGDIQSLANRVETIVAPKTSPESSSPQPPPTAPPIMAAARQIKLEASFALRNNQMISFDLTNFQTDANLDTLPLSLPIRSQNIAGFYEPAATDIQIKRFDIGHGTSINNLRLNAIFNTETDTFGNRSTTTPRQLAADLESLHVGHKLANIFTPDPLLKTDLNLSLQAAGNLEDLSFLTQISPLSAPTTTSNQITIAGRVDLGDPDKNRLPEYKVSLAAHQIDPKQLLHLDYVLDGNFAANLKDATILIEGQSFDPETMSVDANFAADSLNLQIDQPETKQSDTYQIDTIYLSAQYADKLATLQQLGLLTPYIDAFASGIFDPSGTFSAELRTTADTKQTARASSLSPKLMKTRPPAQADLKLEVTGLFDPDIKPVQDALQSAQLTAVWNFKDFLAESIQITRSKGNINAGILRKGPPQKPVYAADFKLNTESRGLRAASARAATLSARAQANAALSLPIDNPLQALQSMSFNTQLTTAGLRAGSNQLDAATIHINIDQKPDPKSEQAAKFDYSLHTTLNNLHAADATIKALATDLQGSISLANTLGASNAPPIGLDAVRRISARGKLSALELRLADNHVDKINTTLQIDGPLNDLLGNIQASATEVTAASKQFDNIDLNLTFAPQRAVQLTATAVPQPDAKRAISASIAGNYHADLAGFDLTGLKLATRRTAWTLQPNGKQQPPLKARATDIVFTQFLLQNGGQKIHIDGAFRPASTQSLDLFVENFDLAALRYGWFLDSLPTIAGQINFMASLRGTMKKPQLSSAIKAQSIVVNKHGPFFATTSLDYRNERLKLADLDLQAFGKPILSGHADVPMIFDLNGKFALPLDRPLDFSLKLADSELADFRPYVDILEQNNVSGSVNGSISMNGTLDKPNLQASFELAHGQFIGTFGHDQIDLRDLSTQTKIIYTPPVGNRGGLMLNSNIQLVDETVASFELSTPLPLAQWIQEEINATGTGFEITSALLNTPVRLALNVPGFDVQKIPLDSLRAVDAAGIAKIDISANGTFGNPEGKIKVSLADFGWQHFRDIFIDLDAKIANRVLNIEQLRLEWDKDELVVASGTVPIPFSELIQGQAIADLPADFTIELRETLVSKLSAIDYDFARIRGSVAGYVQMKGSLRNPEFTARAGLFNTELGDGRSGTIALSIDGKDNLVNAQASICRDQQNVLLANAKLPILTDLLALSVGTSPLIDGELDIKIKSDKMEIAQVLPAKLVEEIITDTSGILDIDLQVAGTWKATTASGDIILKDGAATMPAFGRRVEKVQANINISDDQYTINEISLRDGPSSASIKGKIKHRALRPQDLDINIQTDDFNVGGFATDFPVYVRSKIAAKGTLAGPNAEVDVKITNLNVIVADTQAAGTLPTSLNEDIIIIESRSRRGSKDPREVANLAASDQESSGLLDMRVRVDVARDSWIRHPMGDVNLQANILADIRGGAVILSGQADALRGQVDFIGKRFVVQPSNVLFTGAVPPDPRLAVEATYPLDRAVVDAIGEPTTGEARIIFRVTGTATSPHLELSSDPPMTDSEILFVLVTGRPPDRSDAGQDEGVANRALGAVSGLFLGMLQDKLAGSIPIDVLKIEPGAHGVGRIEVGKYITPDVFASIRRDFGDEEIDASNIVRIEYHFLSRWMLELVYSDQGDGELNMYWDVY